MAKLNAFILILLLLAVTINQLQILSVATHIGFLNEAVFILVFLLYFIKVLYKHKVDRLFIYVIILLLYSFFQILLRNLPSNHIIQGIIYIEFIVFFLYYKTLSDSEKADTIYYIGIYFKRYFYLLVLPFVIIDFIDPSVTRTLLTGGHEFEKGINGFYLQSVFGSTTGLSQYCLLMIIVAAIYRYSTQKALLKKWEIILIILICFLSFSRKENMMMFLLVSVLYCINRFDYIRKSHLIIITIFVLCLTSIYLSSFFKEANLVAMEESYIRTEMIRYSIDISKATFPFGTGVGTFGSLMSVNYTDIYELYDVPDRILHGYNGDRGPIYDAFLFTFFTEQGVGIILYLLVIFKIIKQTAYRNNHKLKYIKQYIAVLLLVMSVFAPVLTNSFGLCLFSMLGLITDNTEYSYE